MLHYSENETYRKAPYLWPSHFGSGAGQTPETGKYLLFYIFSLFKCRLIGQMNEKNFKKEIFSSFDPKWAKISYTVIPCTGMQCIKYLEIDAP